MWVNSLGWEDPLEREMATPFRFLTWKIPWTEEPGRLHSKGSQSQTCLNDWACTHIKQHEIVTTFAFMRTKVTLTENTRHWFFPAEQEICIQVRKQQLELDMEQQTISKSGKEYVKACHCAYLTYMQSTSRETLDWMKHKLESRLPGEISITSDMQMTPPLWQKVKKK